MRLVARKFHRPELVTIAHSQAGRISGEDPSVPDFATRCRRRIQHVPVPLLIVAGYGLYVSTTGLAVSSVHSDYTPIGQLIVLVAFQVGGLGYMTLSSFLALGLMGNVGPFRTRMSRGVFCLPEGTSLRVFFRSVVDVVFETVSALGTVGLSRGATSLLSDTSKVVVIALMFMGRVGTMTAAAALGHVLLSDEVDDCTKPEEALTV